MTPYGHCDWCGDVLSDRELFHGSICEGCEIEREQEEAAAHEAEYEDARWDLAQDYGYDAP